jgi:hypothetical protein
MIHVSPDRHVSRTERLVVPRPAPGSCAVVGLLLVLLTAGPVGALESWQSCCGATCLRTVAGLLHDDTPLAEVRRLVQPNARGEVSLAALGTAAEKMGFHAVGLRVRAENLERCAAPVIAYVPPRHFVVLLGLGRRQGVLLIDPPRWPRPMTLAEIDAPGYWNVVAVSRNPLSTAGYEVRGTAPGKPRDDGPPRRQGSLEFDAPQWRFGSLRTGRKVTHAFSFRNTGKQPVILRPPKADCSCLKATHLPTEIPPDAAAQIEITLDTTGLTGFITKTLVAAVRPADRPDAVEWIRLQVSGEISRAGELVALPARVLVPDLAPGALACRTITLRRIAAQRPNLAKITCDSPNLQARAAPAPTDDGATRIALSVRAPLEVGPFAYRLVLETDDPNHTTVAVNVAGNTVSPLSSEPPRLFLGVGTPGDRLKESVHIVSRADRPFNIRRVSLTCPQLAAAFQPARESRTDWQVTITSATPLRPGLLTGAVVVETDEPNAPPVRIPLTGLVAAADVVAVEGDSRIR